MGAHRHAEAKWPPPAVHARREAESSARRMAVAVTSERRMACGEGRDGSPMLCRSSPARGGRAAARELVGSRRTGGGAGAHQRVEPGWRWRVRSGGAMARHRRWVAAALRGDLVARGEAGAARRAAAARRGRRSSRLAECERRGTEDGTRRLVEGGRRCGRRDGGACRLAEARRRPRMCSGRERPLACLYRTGLDLIFVFKKKGQMSKLKN